MRRTSILLCFLSLLPTTLSAQQQQATDTKKKDHLAELEERVRALESQITLLEGKLKADRAQTVGSAETTLNWESQARLHRGLTASSGTLILGGDGVEFRPTKGSSLHWPFVDIQTFDLLTPRRLVISGYENRSWHRHGEKKFRFDLSVPMPPLVASELARRVAKPVRNGDPHPDGPSIAMIPARHRTRGGGTNGVVHFRSDAIDYVTTTGKGGRSWRWSDIQTLANPDPFHLRVDGYRETFVFELKQPLSRELFDRLWDQVYARDLNGLTLGGSPKKP